MMRIVRARLSVNSVMCACWKLYFFMMLPVLMFFISSLVRIFDSYVQTLPFPCCQLISEHLGKNPVTNVHKVMMH